MSKNRFKIIIKLCIVVAIVIGIGICSQSVFADSQDGAKSCVNTMLFGEVCDSCNGGATMKIVAQVVKILSIGIGIMGVIGLMVVGIQYMTAGGDVTNTMKAKKRLGQILIGLACYIVIFGIANFLFPGGIATATLDSNVSLCKEKTTTDIIVNYPKEKIVDNSTKTSDISDNGSSTALPGGGTETYTYKKKEYIVAKTKTSLSDYMNTIKKYKVEQDKQACRIIGGKPACTNSSRDNDKCLSFAQTYVHDMYFGTYTSDWCASQYVRTGWDDIQSDSMSEILKRTYEEINNGRPVVILVHYIGSKSRHFVAAVGYRSSVKSAGDLDKKDLLLLNTKNGLTTNETKLEMIRDTHSPHKYRIFVLKKSVLNSTRKNMATCSK